MCTLIVRIEDSIEIYFYVRYPWWLNSSRALLVEVALSQYITIYERKHTSVMFTKPVPAVIVIYDMYMSSINFN